MYNKKRYNLETLEDKDIQFILHLLKKAWVSNENKRTTKNVIAYGNNIESIIAKINE